MKKVMLLAVAICMMLSACNGKDTAYVDHRSEVVQWGDNLAKWENAKTWEEVDEYSDWVYAQVTYEQVTQEYPIIETQELDYSSNGVYFDNEKIQEMAGDKFDVNAFVAKYAMGTGVILICLVLTVASTIGPTPLCCFFAGALEGSVTTATRGAALGAAVQAVCTAIKTQGNIEETFYQALEGSSDGYVWGALIGTITGSLGNAYCFDGDTCVWTEEGLAFIKDVKEGDSVCSYDATNGICYQPVSKVVSSMADEMIEVSVNGETIACTPSHPWLSASGWKSASLLQHGDYVLGCDGIYYSVEETHRIEKKTRIYSLCVEDSHCYVVGNTGFLVHNRCKINEKYAGTTVMCNDPVLKEKYPNGVPFTEQGYPDFSEYAKETLVFEPVGTEGCLTGNHSRDIRMANKIMGYDRTPVGYTWHHSEDMRTLQLVPTDLHRGIRHSGGASLIREMLRR